MVICKPFDLDLHDVLNIRLPLPDIRFFITRKKGEKAPTIHAQNVMSIELNPAARDEITSYPIILEDEEL